jgi:hypothetical protein
MRPAPQVLASALRSLTQKVSEPPSLDFETELAPQGDDPQPATTRRKRSASACSLAAKSRARLACSAACAASDPPWAAMPSCTRDLQFDLGNRLGQLGDLLPEQPTLRPQLLDAHEQIRPAHARIGHHRKSVPANA